MFAPILELSVQDWRKTIDVNEEGKPHSVRATLLSPGAVYTSFWHARPEFSPADMLSMEEEAQTIWEVGPFGGYINGSTLVRDGGLSAHVANEVIGF
ncbi:hypothetical protein [Archangium primigenium]|uniref:hypothetical protein n=1 Tax=[Archangium] primigenium TaxID=2792470 RepID=UPI001956E24C|nr:hypothetical protein [Archangium primigenium]MBM7115157.1 hypothetical protein [Archangium primigenium]